MHTFCVFYQFIIDLNGSLPFQFHTKNDIMKQNLILKFFISAEWGKVEHFSDNL